MRRFKNILLLTRERPGERATVARAAALAKRNGARLTLVEVVEQLPRDMQELITAAPPIDLVKLVVKDRREGLEALAAPLRDQGIRVSAAVLSGSPFLELIRQVVRRKHDLVILSAEGQGGRLSVVHLWSLPGETFYRNRMNVSRKELEAMLAEAEEASRQRVDELLGRYALDDVRHDTHLLKGEARDRIPELVRETKADLLVMGTVCRTGVPGFFIGNTAENVLQHVDCSLLAVKPKGFVTPVTI